MHCFLLPAIIMPIEFSWWSMVGFAIGFAKEHSGVEMDKPEIIRTHSA